MHYFGVKEDDELTVACKWLGLFENKPVDKAHTTLFDILANQMFERMMLGKEEKDMVILVHTFKVTMPDGHQEIIRSKMVDYGTRQKIRL